MVCLSETLSVGFIESWAVPYREFSEICKKRNWKWAGTRNTRNGSGSVNTSWDSTTSSVSVDRALGIPFVTIPPRPSWYSWRRERTLICAGQPLQEVVHHWESHPLFDPRCLLLAQPFCHSRAICFGSHWTCPAAPPLTCWKGTYPCPGKTSYNIEN